MKSELVEELNREARIETRIETRQEDLIRFAKRKFGNSDRIALEINSILDAERLVRMMDGIFDVDSLDELLAID